MLALAFLAASWSFAAPLAFEHGGRSRSYLLVGPSGASAPRPVVIALHGGGGDGAKLRKHLDRRLDALASREGFLVVYPDGVGKHWNDGRKGNDADSEADDIGFLEALAERLVKDGKADPRRLYLVGISNGGFMAHAAACASSGRWAAIGAVAASLGEAVAASGGPAEVPRRRRSLPL